MSEYYPPPRKALGQNFLTDGNIIAKILRSAAIEAEDFVLEVGPGRGALTDLLVQRAAEVVAVEFDRELARILRLRFSENPQVVIHEQDILKVDFAQLLGDRRYKVVANLPYNISTPVLFRFLEERRRFSRLVLMLQKRWGSGWQRKLIVPTTALSRCCWECGLISGGNFRWPQAVFIRSPRSIQWLSV